MKRLLVFALSITTTLLYSQPTTLKLASDVWPPFTDVNTRFTLAIDLVHEALERSDVQEQTKILSFTEVLNGIASKQYDGSAALWRSPEREKTMLFSEPYLENRLILVGKKGSNVSAGTLSALKGKRIAVVESYAYGPLLNQTADVVLVKGKSDQQNLERLLKAEVDYMLVDALLIEYLLKYEGAETAQYLAIGDSAFVKLPLHFALRKDFPNAEKIIKNFNAAIKKMVVDGAYNRILQLNWVETDVDGDGLPEMVLSGNKAGTEAPAKSYVVMGQPATAAPNKSHYVIEGQLYSDWNAVPDKYKVAQGSYAGSDKKDFGLSFKF